ncbi:MAG TPA: bifunctional riboflavin kinase/FAD synthetase [Candidatus Competibacteraceae bacterium]|nr:bifunctional riboflavin kinase/FAD synthetase [Candidatus Competibacteraceae bacterium]
MELIRGQHNLRPRHRECVVTIGTFDGLHLGHQAIIEQLAQVGAEHGLPRVLITFEPTPAEFFAADAAPARLTRLREKLELLRAQPLERVLVLRFDAALAALSAEEFVHRLLVDSLAARCVIVGDDFRFGHGARGDFALLAALGRRWGFQVQRQTTFSLDGERVSSSRVRQALADGDLDLAARLLGRPYAIQGRVARGDQLGRTIGFPTANVPLHRRVCPLSGVYAVQVAGIDAAALPGMANIGSRPTVNGRETRLEVHLFDFQGDIYGRPLRVDFLHRLRPEQRFPSLDALRQQLHADAERARRLLATTAS